MTSSSTIALLSMLAACRMGFEPIERTGSGDPSVDAPAPVVDSQPIDATLVQCRQRIANTDNSYLPAAQCLSEVNDARATCNADPSCVLTGYYWGPNSGINDTGACADGGGNTGCRQWVCSPRASIPTDHRTI